MVNKIIISDTSCLIAFDRINRLDILQQVFTEIITTKEVAVEFEKPLPVWITIQTVKDQNRITELENIVDKGEATAIALAIETNDCTLIIDEKKGRKLATRFHIHIIGSLRILLFAKQKGVIPSVKEIIVELEKSGFRFSNLIVNEILNLSGEL